MAKKPEAVRLAMMRAAKTSAENKHGMGGLPKGGGHKPRPITLPKTPWDDKDDVGDETGGSNG